MPNVTGKTVVIAGAHHRDRVILEAMHRMGDLGAVVVVQIVNDGAVDDMRTLAAELLGHEPRIDVLAHVGTRRTFASAVLQPSRSSQRRDSTSRATSLRAASSSA